MLYIINKLNLMKQSAAKGKDISLEVMTNKISAVSRPDFILALALAALLLCCFVSIGCIYWK